MTTPYLIVLVSFNVIPAALFWDNTRVLQLFVLGFALLYLALYWRIVRLKSPRLLILRQRTEPRPGTGQPAEG